jgi:hypothetical protein
VRRWARASSARKTFDIGVEGPAHVGMLPDVIAEFAAMGLTEGELDSLMSSAEGYAGLWDKAWAVADPSQRVPDGTILEDETGARYVIEGGARFHVPNDAVFDDLQKAAGVRHVTANETAGLPIVPVDRTLLRDTAGAVSVIYGGARFHVPDPATFDSLYKWADVRQLWDQALDEIPVIPRDGTAGSRS